MLYTLDCMANHLSLFNTLYTLDCIAQHQHQRGLSGTLSALASLVANGCLGQHRLMPCVSGASPTSAPVGPWCTKVPRAI